MDGEDLKLPTFETKGFNVWVIIFYSVYLLLKK
jgi:hypothetical protein